MKQLDVFDNNYIPQQQTEAIGQKKLGMKDFLKNPVSKDDIEKYGSSKPKRVLIRASIQHGKS
jgi:hypothetical protein